MIPLLAALAAADDAPDAAVARPGDVLLHETFDDRRHPGWLATPALATGEGEVVTARWGVRDGALWMRVERDDTLVETVRRAVPLRGARLVRVSGRMRATNLDPAFADVDVCSFYAGPRRIQPLPVGVLAADADWVAVERIVGAPAEGSELHLGLVLTMPGRVWLDDVTVEVVAPESLAWTTTVDGPLTYHTLPGDRVPDALRATNAAEHARMADLLGVPGAPVVYRKYPDVEVKRLLTNDPRGAHVVGNEVHTHGPSDVHSVAHALAAPLGAPPPLLVEGLAVWAVGKWYGQPSGTAARTDVWISLATLLDGEKFREATPAVAYTEAGALAAWLVDTKGKDALLGLYGTLRADAPVADNVRALEAAVGLPVAQIDNLVWAWVVANRPNVPDAEE